MKKYDEMSREELLALREELEARYEEAKGKGLKLDMSRGCLLYTSIICVLCPAGTNRGAWRYRAISSRFSALRA